MEALSIFELVAVLYRVMLRCQLRGVLAPFDRLQVETLVEEAARIKHAA